MKMRPHPAVHPHSPLIKKFPPPPPPHPLPAFHLRFAMPALQSDELVFRLVRMNVTNFPPLPSKVGLILAWLLHRSRQGRWGPCQWGQERLPRRASLGLRQATSTKFSNLTGYFSLNCWFSVSRHSK